MSTARDIRSDFKTGQRDIVETAAQTAANLAGTATETLDRAREAAGNAASEVAERGRVAGQQLEQVAGNLKGAVDKSVKDQPMTTLAVAAAVGFVVGALWKS